MCEYQRYLKYNPFIHTMIFSHFTQSFDSIQFKSIHSYKFISISFIWAVSVISSFHSLRFISGCSLRFCVVLADIACLLYIHTFVHSFVRLFVCYTNMLLNLFPLFQCHFPPPFQPLTNCITESHHPHIWRELRLAGEDVVFVFLHPWMTYPYWRSFAHLDIGAGVFSLRYSITFGKEKKMKHFVVNYRKTLSPISISSRFYLVIPPSPSTSTCTPLSPSLHANIFIIKAIQPLLICLLLFSTLIVYYL